MAGPSSLSDFEEELERFCESVSLQLARSDLVPPDIAPNLWQARTLVSAALSKLRMRHEARPQRVIGF
jgi:hypothetical protein